MSTVAYDEAPNSVTGEADAKAKARLLLTLWALGGITDRIKKSELTSKVKQKRQGKKIGVHQSLYDELRTAGAIRIEKENQVPVVSMTELGKQMLVEALSTSEFEFDGTVVAVRIANGLVELIRDLSRQGYSFSQSPPAPETNHSSPGDLPSEF
ncbi:MAG: hypothetical protein ACFBSC_01530 [Microcoleaceae cyanobacterium]